MFKKILVLFISPAATIYFIFFSNLSVNLIDQSTTYNIDFIFNENFPKLRTHELILGFRSNDYILSLTIGDYPNRIIKQIRPNPFVGTRSYIKLTKY